MTATISHFWVKAYDCYNRLSCNPNHDDRDSAFTEFEEKRDSGRFYFVQMGVMASDGSIVLNEWRKPTPTETPRKLTDAELKALIERWNHELDIQSASAGRVRYPAPRPEKPEHAADLERFNATDKELCDAIIARSPGKAYPHGILIGGCVYLAKRGSITIEVVDRIG